MSQRGMLVDPTTLSALEAHRSIRRYKPEPIPAVDVQRMMAAAIRASSGGSGQLYSIIRVTDSTLRQRLAKAVSQPHIEQAAEFFVACLDVHRLQHLLEHRGVSVGTRSLTLYATIDLLLAVANLATAAEALGYGICYIGSLQRVLDQIIELLQLPKGVCPLLGLCVGIPDESPELTPRLPLEIIFHENHYDEPAAADIEQCYAAMAAATYAGGWFNTLSQYFTAGQEYEIREVLWRRALVQQGFQVA